MKKNDFILLCLILLTLVSCSGGGPTDKQLKAKADSIAKAEADSRAYLNRPWKLGEFVDSFGDKTGAKFIYTELKGTYSNSAVAIGDNYIEIQVQKDAAGIFMKTYSKEAPKKVYEGFKIQLKNSNGLILVLTAIHDWNEKGGIKIDYDFLKFKSFIEKSTGLIKVYMSEGSSTFSFAIDSTGFGAEFNLI